MLTRIRTALTRNRELRADDLLERDEDYWDVVQPARQKEIERTQRTTIECPRCGGTGRLGTLTHTKQGDW